MFPPRTLSLSETQKFTAQIGRRGLAPQLASETLLYTGLRLGEYLHLHWRDVVGLDYRPRSEVHILAEWTKTRTARTIPIPPPLQDLYCYFLERHLDERKGYPALHWPLWPGDRETGFKMRHLQDIFREAGLRAIGRAVTPHMLRHTYASNLLAVSNTRIVQLALGHKSLSSTQIYLHPSSTEVAEATSRLSERYYPREERHNG